MPLANCLTDDHAEYRLERKGDNDCNGTEPLSCFVIEKRCFRRVQGVTSEHRERRHWDSAPGNDPVRGPISVFHRGGFWSDPFDWKLPTAIGVAFLPCVPSIMTCLRGRTEAIRGLIAGIGSAVLSEWLIARRIRVEHGEN